MSYANYENFLRFFRAFPDIIENASMAELYERWGKTPEGGEYTPQRLMRKTNYHDNYGPFLLLQEVVELLASMYTDYEIINIYKEYGVRISENGIPPKELKYPWGFSCDQDSLMRLYKAGPLITLKLFAHRLMYSVQRGGFDFEEELKAEHLTPREEQSLQALLIHLGEKQHQACRSWLSRKNRKYARTSSLYKNQFYYTKSRFEEDWSKVANAEGYASKLQAYMCLIQRHLNILLSDKNRCTSAARSFARMMIPHWVAPFHPFIGRQPKLRQSSGNPVGRPKKATVSISDARPVQHYSTDKKRVVEPLSDSVDVSDNTLTPIKDAFRIVEPDYMGRRLQRTNENGDARSEVMRNIGGTKQFAVRYGDQTIRATHLVWYLSEGEWPTGKIFCMDSNILNTDRKNLSIANGRKNPFKAVCRINGKLEHIGYYATKEESKQAVMAYKHLRDEGHPAGTKITVNMISKSS